MTHGKYTAVDTQETDAGVHDGVLERLGDTGDLEEVRCVGNDKPRPGAGLGSDNAITEKCATEIGTYDFICEWFVLSWQ
jgi:hypothetical protein